MASLLGPILSLLGFYVALHGVHGAALADAASAVDVAALLVAVPVLVIAYLLRAKRLNGLAGPVAQEGMGPWLVGRLLDETTPSRRGLLYRSFLLAQRDRLPFLQTAAAAAVARGLDLPIGAGLAALGVAASPVRDDALPLLLVLSLGALAGAWLVRTLLTGGRLPAWLLIAWPPAWRECMRQALVLAPSPEAASWTRPRVWLRSAVYGLASWLFLALFLFVLAHAAGMPLGAANVLIVTGAWGLSEALPALPLRLGVFEAALAGPAVWLGAEPERALFFALLAHGAVLLVVLFSGFWQLVWLKHTLPALPHEAPRP